MSPTQIITLTALVIYFGMLGLLNWRGQRGQTAEAYAIGGRKVGYIATTGTLAAGIRDGSGIILWISFAYTAGYGGLWLFAGVFTAFCLMALFGPRVRKLSIERDYLTVNQMIRDDIGPYTQKIVTLVMLVIALLIMSMQIYVAGNFFSSLLRQPDWIGMVGIALIVGAYLFMGGYTAVIRTNTIQFFWILSLIAIPLMIVPERADITNYASIFSMDMKDRIALFLIGFCFPLASGDTWQHLFSARSNKVIRRAFPAGGLVLVIMTVSLIFLGFGIKQYLPDADPKMALFDFFQAELTSPFILAYIAIVVMAITTSDLDSQTYLFISTSIKNVAPPSIAQDKDNYKRWARYVLVGALGFTTLIALTISDIVQFLFQVVSLLYVMSPVFTFAGLGLIKRSTIADRLITVTICIGIAVYAWLFTNGLLENNLMYNCVPAALSLAGCLLIALKQRFRK
jgi:Na+/proline symporter